MNDLKKFEEEHSHNTNPESIADLEQLGEHVRVELLQKESQKKLLFDNVLQNID